MVGLGICTYNRPEYFAQCLATVKEHLIDTGKVDFVYVVNDGSDEKYRREYEDIIMPYSKKYSNLYYVLFDDNRGVASAKNWCLKQMMEAGCDWLFLMEDDIIVKSPDVTDMYIAAALDSGVNHFMFAHHGHGNVAGPLRTNGSVALYENCVGAFTMFTRQGIIDAGYFDETFVNAVEHIEHTHRLSLAGYHPPLNLGYADVILSKHWLEEIPGSIDDSSIRARADWKANIIKGLEHWKQKDGDGFPFERWLQALKDEQ